MPMSINQPSRAVSDILNRAATDSAFRNLLYTDPGAALTGYNLTDTERAELSDPEAVRRLLSD